MHTVLLSELYQKIRNPIDSISPIYINIEDQHKIWFEEKNNSITIIEVTIKIDSEIFNFGTKSIVFENCVFSKNSLQIKGFNNLKHILKFESCIFEIPVSISGIFEDLIFFSSGNKKNKFERSLKIYGQFRNLKIDNIVVNGKVQISDVAQIESDDVFEISNSDFKNDCRILKNNFQNFKIENSTFNSIKSNDKLDVLEERNSLEIDENEILKTCDVKNVTLKQNEPATLLKVFLKLYNNTLKGNINIENIISPNLSIDISSLEAKKRLNIKQTDEKSKIDNLIFKRLPPRTYLENLTIGELDLSRNTIEDKEILSLTNLKINLLKIENFINYGFFTINNFKPNKGDKIKISNSTLGKLDLVSCNLSDVSFEIDNSKLVDIFYTDTVFPDEIGSKKENRKAKLEQQRDTYGQLKVVSEKVGNRFQALTFQAKEMTAYFTSIKCLSWDKVTLGAMYLSNNFRQNWVRGVIFTFVIGLIPYYCMVASFENVKWCCCCWQETYDVFCDYLGKYFEFINPAHKSDFLEKENTYGVRTYFCDFIGRIFIGFGIYQTIQAFRKFGKE